MAGLASTAVQKRRTVTTVFGALLMLLAGLLYAWSIYRGPLGEAFPQWSVSQISLTFTISMVCYCLGVFFAGKMSARFSGRVMLLIAAIMLAIGFCGLSFALHGLSPGLALIALYVLYGVFCGGGAGIVYNVVLNALSKWYPGRIGTIAGLLLFCYGLGGIVLGGAVDALINAIGLVGTLFALGAAIAVLVAVGSFFVRSPNEREAEVLSAMVPVAVQHKAAAGKNFAVREMAATPVFWLFFLWNIVIVTGGLIVLNSAAPIAVSFGAPAILGLIVSVFSGIGRLGIGAVFDLKGRNTAMGLDSILMLLAGLALIGGAATGNLVFIFIGLPLAGIGYGGAPPTLQAIVNNYFGAENYAINMSVMTFSVIPGAVIGPMISSSLLEKSGGYGSSFIMFTIVAALAILLNVLLRRAARKGKFE